MCGHKELRVGYQVFHLSGYRIDDNTHPDTFHGRNWRGDTFYARYTRCERDRLYVWDSWELWVTLNLLTWWQQPDNGADTLLISDRPTANLVLSPSIYYSFVELIANIWINIWIWINCWLLKVPHIALAPRIKQSNGIDLLKMHVLWSSVLSMNSDGRKISPVPGERRGNLIRWVISGDPADTCRPASSLQRILVCATQLRCSSWHY